MVDGNAKQPLIVQLLCREQENKNVIIYSSNSILESGKVYREKQGNIKIIA